MAALAAAVSATIPMALVASPANAVTSAGGASALLTTLAPTLNAQGCPGTMTSGGVVSPAGGHPFIVCTGRIRSFDGTPLDTDVTIPTAASAAPRPLMIFLHGWGNSKTDWESSTLDGTGKDHLTFELWPQAWQFIPGDTIKLELTQDDPPVWRPDNLPSSLTFTHLDLALPLATRR
jgi:hypothetical protein